MKRFLAILLLISLLCLCGCGSSASQPTTSTTETTAETTAESTAETTTASTAPESSAAIEPPAATCTPVLYKVTAENGAVLYLFGSIHATDSRAFPLPAYVMQAYEESDYLAVECDLNAFASDIAAQTDMAMKMVLSDGTTIADHIGEDVYTAAKELLSANGLYYSVFDMYGPAMWMSLVESAVVEMSGLDSEDGIDLYFLELAAEENKEIREVESAEFQYNMLLGFSDELMTFIISSTTDDPKGAADATAALYETWLAGDEGALITMLEEDVSQEEAELYAEYQTKVVTERNLGMADTAEAYLAQGGTGFFVVGAAHILGEGGCADLLAARGYTVERVE